MALGPRPHSRGLHLTKIIVVLLIMFIVRVVLVVLFVLVLMMLVFVVVDLALPIMLQFD